VLVKHLSLTEPGPQVSVSSDYDQSAARYTRHPLKVEEAARKFGNERMSGVDHVGSGSRERDAQPERLFVDVEAELPRVGDHGRALRPQSVRSRDRP